MDERDQTRLWQRWLVVASAIVVGVGGALVVLALVGVPPAMMDVLYLPGEPDVSTADTLSFAIGVTGSVMVGWGASMLFIYLDPKMVRRPRVARAYLIGAIAWFMLDCAVSLALGAMINVVGNVLFVALLLPPLAGLASQDG
jgi:hypothetical protein